jgi:hypothetical protein
MVHRFPTAALTALAATLLLAGTALAGGWANAIMDEAPQDPPSAGEPVTIGFMLMQHGVTPVDTGPTMVIVRNASTGEEVRVAANHRGQSGHWVAVITFPSDGTWRYEVTHDLIVGMKGFNPVTIGSAGPATAATSSTPVATTQPVTSLLLALLLTVAVGGAFVLTRRRRESLRTARA